MTQRVEIRKSFGGENSILSTRNPDIAATLGKRRGLIFVPGVDQETGAIGFTPGFWELEGKTAHIEGLARQIRAGNFRLVPRTPGDLPF